jgi:hypothetical protein
MNAKIKQLSSFDQTVLDITKQAANDNEAATYIQDWLNDKDTRCTRTAAARYIANARQHDAELNKE